MKYVIYETLDYVMESVFNSINRKFTDGTTARRLTLELITKEIGIERMTTHLPFFQEPQSQKMEFAANDANDWIHIPRENPLRQPIVDALRQRPRRRTA